MPSAKNFGYGTVLTAPSPATSGTSLVLNSGQGALMPTVPFNATVWPVGVQPSSSNAEVVTVTAISTDTLTITRAQEGSTARTVIVGDQVSATITANVVTQSNRFTPQSAATQDIVLDASNDFLIPKGVDVSGSNGLEIPATSNLEVASYYEPGSNIPSKYVYNSVAFNISLASTQNVGTADTLVNFDTKNFDVGNNTDVSNNKGRFIAPIAGAYHFDANVYATTAGTGIGLSINFYKNGASVVGPSKEPSIGSGTDPAVAIGATMKLAAGDYIEVYCGTVTAAKALNVATGNTTFSGFLITPI